MLIRKDDKKYSIDEIRNLTKDVLWIKRQHDKSALVNLDGDDIYGNSQRYQVFFSKGCKCSKCGIEGKYFVKERSEDQNRWHLNLYAIDENGEEVLMTKDHIIPKSKGGKDSIENYQTMCIKCNMQKADSI